MRESVIGDDQVMRTPYGRRRVTYADYTASGGRWTSSRTSSATRCCRATPTRTPSPPARGCRRPGCGRTPAQIIHDAVGGDARDRGASSPGRARPPRSTSWSASWGCGCPPSSRPVRAVGAHPAAPSARWCSSGRSSTTPTSCPWRESIADVVVIPEDADGHIDLARLRAELERHADRPLKIGSFSAASNVTGIVCDTARDLRRCCTSTARCRSGTSPPPRRTSTSRCTARPGSRRPYKDAVFISPHKFIGGPATPGRAGGAAGAAAPTGCPTCPAAARSPTSTRPTTATSTTPRTARRAARRRSSSRSGPAWCSSSRRRSAPTPSGAREERFLRRAVAAWQRRAGHRAPRQPRRRAAVDRVLRGAIARRPLPAPQLRGGAAQRPVRHPGARRLLVRRARTATGCSASTSSARTSSSARSPAAARASSPAGCG